MHGLIELGLIGFLGIGNSPFPVTPHPTVISSLKWELQPFRFLFVGGENAARCNPSLIHRWNPKTALWDIHIGVRAKGLSLSLGHVSEHGVDQIVPPTESRDYLSLKYKVTF